MEDNEVEQTEEQTVEQTLEERNEEVRNRLLKPVVKAEEEAVRVEAEARDLADAYEMINYANLKKRLILSTITDDEGRPYYVEYCPLRISDRTEIASIKDKDEDIQTNNRNRHAVYLLLKRANPEKWTKDVVYGLPASFIDTILIEYGRIEAERFLLPALKQSLDGFRSMVTPRNSS